MNRALLVLGLVLTMLTTLGPGAALAGTSLVGAHGPGAPVVSPAPGFSSSRHPAPSVFGTHPDPWRNWPPPHVRDRHDFDNAPRGDLVWVPGFWSWTDFGWAWVPGHWAVARR